MTINITIKSNPETINFRYLGDIVQAAEPAAKKARAAATPKPGPIPTVTDIDTCGAITVNGCRIRCFFSKKGLYYSITDIARAYGKKPEQYKFSPAFLVYARAPHSGHQFMKWVESAGLIQYINGHAGKNELFGVCKSSSTYKQL